MTGYCRAQHPTREYATCDLRKHDDCPTQAHFYFGLPALSWFDPVDTALTFEQNQCLARVLAFRGMTLQKWLAEKLIEDEQLIAMAGGVWEL